MPSDKSHREVVKRAQRYYPPQATIKDLKDHKDKTGETKSALAVKLLKSFFAAKKKEGKYPTVITILP